MVVLLLFTTIHNQHIADADDRSVRKKMQRNCWFNDDTERAACYAESTYVDTLITAPVVHV